MMCGAKCFVVRVEVDGVKQEKIVRARTPVAARKTIRKEYGEQAEIFSVKAENR